MVELECKKGRRTGRRKRMLQYKRLRKARERLKLNFEKMNIMRIKGKRRV